jgi:hypothetical protein
VQSVILWSSRCVIAHLCHYCLDFWPFFSYFWIQAEGAALDSGCLMFINRLWGLTLQIMLSMLQISLQPQVRHAVRHGTISFFAAWTRGSNVSAL